MRVAFFSEAGYTGKVSRSNPNMRTDQAWVCALDAIHFPVTQLPNEHFDIGIVIIPKEQNRYLLASNNVDVINNIKQICSKVLVMQESTQWDWQDDPMQSMIWYYQQLLNSDGILCHNDIDVPYFKGITSKPSFVLPTLMIEDTIQASNEKQNKVFVAGNWHTTYRGFDAWVIGREFELPMVGFKSGKFKQGEEITGVEYLPWMHWNQFMFELSKCKYGVQTYQASAGQFPLNCAYLGIPCIGYNDINTQKYLHPLTSVERGDVITARKLANKLKDDKTFYNECGSQTKELYNNLYTENKFIEKWNQIVKEF
jgi:hypothetical protein